MSSKNKRDNNVPILYELSGMNPFKPKIYNPHYERHKLKVPFRMLVVGGSGISMKTNGVLWMITEAFDNTFDHIIICVKENEPLYEYFTSKLPPGSFSLYVDEIPDIKEYNKSEWKDKQLLFIFDDMMNSKNHNKQILEYFLRGRKIPKGGNSSMIYITQSFSGMGAMGKSLRQQMNLIMLKKINSMNIVDDIMSEYRLGGRTRDELIRMYNYANDKPQNFLLIDTEAKDEEIFRKNLYEFLE